MPENFPATLPGVLRDNYSSLLAEPSTRRLTFASGRTRQTRRFSLDTRHQNVQWFFTEEQFQTFKAFHRSISNGMDYFNIDLPFGDGLPTVLARFVNGQYSRRQQHPGWRVSAVLEVEDVPYIDEELLESLILVGDVDALESAANSYHIAINETLPALN